MHKINTYNSRFLFPLYAIFFFLTLVIPVAQAATTSPLLLFYSGNIQGETEACG